MTHLALTFSYNSEDTDSPSSIYEAGFMAPNLRIYVFSEFHVQPTVFVCWVIFRPLVNEMEKETHSSILAWRIPGMGAWWAAIYGVAQSRTRLTRLSSSISKLKKVKSELLHPSMGFPGKGTGVGCHFLLQGDLPNPGIDPLSSAL